MGGQAGSYLDQYSSAAAHNPAAAAGRAVASVLQILGRGTEPVFGVIQPTYDQMLAIALLVCGAVIAAAVAERILGGPRGAGWEVLPRTAAACFAAFAGLGVVQYLTRYAELLATAWTAPASGGDATAAVAAAFPASGDQALGSALGMILVALLVMLLVLLLYVEMVLRSALILVTAVFIPLVAVAAIWPRLAGGAARLAEFLALLLMSKFVMVTAVYVGFSMTLYGAQPGEHGMVVGIATLLLAVLSPGLLLRGIRMGEAGTASAVRGWAAGGISAASMVTWITMTAASLHQSRRSGRKPEQPKPAAEARG